MHTELFSSSDNPNAVTCNLTTIFPLYLKMWKAGRDLRDGLLLWLKGKSSQSYTKEYYCSESNRSMLVTNTKKKVDISPSPLTPEISVSFLMLSCEIW